MIHRGATGPGPRTVARSDGAPAGPRPTAMATSRGPNGPAGPRTNRTRQAGRPLVAVAVVAFAVLVAACGSNAPASPGGGPTSPISSPAGSGVVDPLGPGASIRRWPSRTVDAMVALGTADEQIANAGADLQAAVQREDLAGMWGAADGLAKLIDAQLPNVAELAKDPATQAAGAIYQGAFPEISAGAKQLRDAITAGDAQAIVGGTQRLLNGLHAYEPVRALISDLVEQALVQKRMYLR